jgi:hypothetical protein
MKLGEIAHSRAGDKGNISNLSLIAYEESDYEFLKERIKGTVTRYELPKIAAFNFVLKGSLYGGVTRSLALDPHGKSLSSYFLLMEIDENAYCAYKKSLD